VGLAFAVMAAPAQARPIESAAPELGPQQTQQAQQPKVIPYLSHGTLGEAVKSRADAKQPPVISYLSHGLTAADALDPRTGVPLSAGIPAPGDPFIVDVPVTGAHEGLRRTVGAGQPIPDAFERAVARSGEGTPVRPDDRADRFVVGDSPPPASVADGDGFSVDWDNGVPFAIGGLALVLALGLTVAYVRRPSRIAI